MPLIQEGSISLFEDHIGAVNPILGGKPGDAQPPRERFDKSPEARGLALQSIRLDEGFGGLFGKLFNPSNNIYFVSWAWDLSDVLPSQYPGPGVAADSVKIPLKAGKTREFIGDGILLFPAREVAAGLAVRIMLWESNKSTQELGTTLQEVAQTIKASKLANTLALLSLATGAPGVTLAMVAGASAELADAVGGILRQKGDDYVDYYEGYFSATKPWRKGTLEYKGNSTQITLQRL